MRPDPRDNTQVLSPEQLQQLRRARQAVNTAQELIDKAMACGIDCRAEQALATAQAERIDLILANFGGERPRR